MNLFPSVDLLIDTENLLSSTTYPIKRISHCVYCHRSVEAELLDFRKNSYTVHRCMCDHALDELEIKRKVVSHLEDLDRMTVYMDLNRVGTAMYHEKEKKLRDKYKPTV